MAANSVSTVSSNPSLFFSTENLPNGPPTTQSMHVAHSWKLSKQRQRQKAPAASATETRKGERSGAICNVAVRSPWRLQRGALFPITFFPIRACAWIDTAFSRSHRFFSLSERSSPLHRSLPSSSQSEVGTGLRGWVGGEGERTPPFFVLLNDLPPLLPCPLVNQGSE